MSTTNDENLAAFVYKANDLRLEVCETKELQEKEVLVAVHCVGVCGTDVHFLRHGSIDSCAITKPVILGHESSGRVLRIGPNVTNVVPGDRVAIEPASQWRICSLCKCGLYSLCDNAKNCSSPPEDGTMKRFHVHPAAKCHKLPDHVTFEEAALLEPLSVAIHSLQRVQMTAGQKVLICGAGALGLIHMLAAKESGAAEVCMTDIDQGRLKFAHTHGADHIVLVHKDGEVKQFADDIRKKFGGQNPDVTIECTGVESSVHLSILATKSGGKVALVGFAEEELKVPIINAAIREVDICGVFGYEYCYPIALSMVAKNRINLKPLVTHRFPLEQAQQAFETAANSGSEHAIRVLVYCNNKE